MSKPRHAARPLVLVLGDQLDPDHPLLREPGQCDVLMVESEFMLTRRRYHRQRLWLVLASMRRYAEALRLRGFDVHYERAATFERALTARRHELAPSRVLAAEPTTHGARALLVRLGVELVPHARFLCSADTFAAWAGAQKTLRMDDFYRRQRHELGILMDGEGPEGGTYSFDAQNREPASHAPSLWPTPPRDALDREVLASLPTTVFGDPPDGTWATTRAGALRRLDHFIEHVLPQFGPHQDVMLESSFHLGHALLAYALNLGLLHPRELCERAEGAYHAGRVPLASVEGFVRQVIGWREYIWGTYWLFGPDYGRVNALRAHRPLLPLFTDKTKTRMRCVGQALEAVETRGYAHHIQRLMVLGNLGLLAGVEPRAFSDWMQASFIDASEWVMWPNVLGMALYADAGRMSTKPYAAGGAYIHRMSDHCAHCPYDPKQRAGEEACPFTTLYWDFLARNERALSRNHRLRPAFHGLRRLGDLDGVRARAREVLAGLASGSV